MIKRITISFIILLTVVSNISAQKSATYNNSQFIYDNALQLFQNKYYAAAQLEFEKILSSEKLSSAVKTSSEYYASLSSIKLGEKNGDYRMQKFIEENPTSPYKQQAIIDIASYYYDQGKYNKAYNWSKQIDYYDLNDEIRDEFIFKRSYTEYKLGEYDKALIGFNKVLNTSSFGTEAKYYVAHIAYLENRNETALKYFKELKGDDDYREHVSVFISQIYFKQEKYQKAIDEATPLLKNKKSDYFSEMSKLVGESYFNLGDYKNALENLLEYKGKKGRFENSHWYQIAYCYYNNGEFEDAISYYNRIVGTKSELAQNAYYNLAACYLKQDKKNEALNAFSSASEMDFNKVIKEDAFYNYAKLSYEVGNVAESATMALGRYLKEYPNSLHKNEVYQLLVQSYLSSNNYKEVLHILDSTGLNSFKLKTLYQKAAFLQASELFNDEKYSEAKNYYSIAREGLYDQDIRSRALYWRAESDYMLGNFEDALVQFKSFRMENKNKNSYEAFMLEYNLGYTYFKLGDYDDSNREFLAFSNKKIDDLKIKNDTYLRLGDSYFMISKYWPALETYNESLKLKVSGADYAVYQKALCYGLLGKNDKRIETINTMLQEYPKSKLGDDALYLLGVSYTRANSYKKAVDAYNSLEVKYPGSSYVPKAKLKKALIYYNDNKENTALAEYKSVVDKYPSTKEAKEAVAGARKIYIDQGKASEYVSWVKNLDFIDISASQADSTSYLAGEKAFLRGDCNKAISSFNHYLKVFPKGLSKLNAHYYLAECQYKSADYPNALENYVEVLKLGKNEYTEASMVRASELYMVEKDTANAVDVFKRLINESELEQNKTYADVNLMRIYNKQGDLDKAVMHASLLSINTKVSEKVKSESLLIIARAAMERGDVKLARSTYEKLNNLAKGEVKAESMYYAAYFLNKDARYEDSNKMIFEIASKYSAYKYWGAMSLLIMADNFDKLNDQYQAVYTLETVISKFDFEDIKQKAQKMLNDIQAKSTTEIDTTQTQY